MTSELSIRPNVRDATATADLIYDAACYGAGPRLIDRVVLDAEDVDRLPDLRSVARTSGFPLWVDPNTHFLQGQLDPDFAWCGLEYGRAEPVVPGKLTRFEIRILAAQVVQFQLDKGASAVIPAYFYADSPDDPAFAVNLQLIQATSDFLASEGLLGRIALVPVFCGNVTNFGKDEARTRAVDLFAHAAQRAGTASVATLVGPIGDGKETAVKLDRLFQLHLALKSHPAISSVVALRQGLYGEALVASGIDGYECGASAKERCDLKSSVRSHAPRPEDSDRKPIVQAMVYLDPIRKSVKSKFARALLENRGIGSQFVCRDPYCCGRGSTSMLEHRVAHAVNQRSRRLHELDAMPLTGWRLRETELRAARAAKHAQSLTKFLEQVQKDEKRVERVHHRGYESLEIVCRKLREEDSERFAA